MFSYTCCSFCAFLLPWFFAAFFPFAALVESVVSCAALWLYSRASCNDLNFFLGDCAASVSSVFPFAGYSCWICVRLGFFCNLNSWLFILKGAGLSLPPSGCSWLDSFASSCFLPS